MMHKKHVTAMLATGLVLSLGAGSAMADVYDWDGEGGDGDWDTAANWINSDTATNDVKPGAGDTPQIGRAIAAPNPVVVTTTQPDFFKLSVGHFGSTGDLVIDGGQIVTTSQTTMRGGSSVEVKNGGVWEMDNTNGGGGGGTVTLRDTSRYTLTRKSDGVDWDWNIHGSQVTFEHTQSLSQNQYIDLSSGGGGSTIQWIADAGGISTLTSSSYYRKDDVLNGVLDVSAMAVNAGDVLTLIDAAAGLNEDEKDGLAAVDESFDSFTVTGTALGHNLIMDEAADAIRVEFVPEPASFALMGLGGLAMLTRRRRMA